MYHHPQPTSAPKEEPSEKDIYDRALKALEAKKRQLLEAKQRREAEAEADHQANIDGRESFGDGIVNGSSAAVTEDGDGFEAAASFGGARAGFVFKLGVHGLGYYADSTQVTQPANAPDVDSMENHGRESLPQPAPPTSVPLPEKKVAQAQFADKSAEELVDELCCGIEPEPSPNRQADVAGVAPGSAADLDELD